MILQERIEILDLLGLEIKNVLNNPVSHDFPGYKKIYESNPWFTEEFVKFSLTEWSKNLNLDTISSWLSKYQIPDKDVDKTLGIIMAGNIPLVGLHDLICGFICGIKLKIKISSKDKYLTEWIIERINIKISNSIDRIVIVKDFLSDFDSIIATGSNNTNRYFDYYFSDYPRLLRKNRNSVAILDAKETVEDLENLSDDIFVYFGLGCRNVSKIYVPQSYDFNILANAVKKYEYLKNHVKFGNNLEYQYAILSMNSVLHVNYENLLMVENKNFFAPIGIVNFEYYNEIKQVNDYLKMKSNELQCIVSNIQEIEGAITFGNTQHPLLSDYSDKIDTIEFILKI
ncbi:MAG TPA: hypothetical protein PLL66_09670 [Bacteroidales bacterium]|nr:hypothetical protein [Bacteroidales bacterium]